MDPNLTSSTESPIKKIKKIEKDHLKPSRAAQNPLNNGPHSHHVTSLEFTLLPPEKHRNIRIRHRVSLSPLRSSSSLSMAAFYSAQATLHTHNAHALFFAPSSSSSALNPKKKKNPTPETLDTHIPLR